MPRKKPVVPTTKKSKKNQKTLSRRRAASRAASLTAKKRDGMQTFAESRALREAEQRLAALQRDVFKSNELFGVFGEDEAPVSAVRRRSVGGIDTVGDGGDGDGDDGDESAELVGWAGDAHDDDNDGDDEEDDDASARRKRSKKGKHSSHRTRRVQLSVTETGVAADGIGARARRMRNRVVKPMLQIIEEESLASLPKHIPTFVSATARPSREPTRHFCAMCGNLSGYTCPQCLMRYCSKPCFTEHRELKRCR